MKKLRSWWKARVRTCEEGLKIVVGDVKPVESVEVCTLALEVKHEETDGSQIVLDKRGIHVC